MQVSTLKANLAPLLKLAIPLCLTGITQSAVFFFETLFLAHLNEQALAAGALVSWLCGTIAVVSFGILSAINIIISHQYGAKDEEGIRKSIRDGLLLACLLTLPTFLLYWNIAPIFLVLGQNPSIVALASSYLHALAWGTLPNCLMFALLEFLMGIGHARIIMLFTFCSVSLNILLSYLLIFGIGGLPALGIAGAGWGMTLSFWVSTLFLFVYIVMNKRYRHYFENITWFSKPLFLWEMLRLGIPMGLMYCIEVGFFFALTLLMGLLGTETLAANQIVMQYLGILMASIFSLAQAVTIRMGHLLGQRNYTQAEEANRLGLYLSGTYMSIVALIFWCFPKALISLDLDIHSNANAEIVILAQGFFAIAAIFQIFEALRISLFGGLRGLKDTRFTLLTSILSFWCLALPLGYFLSKTRLQASGFWWGMLLGSIFSFLLLQWRFKIRMKAYSRQARA